MWKVFLQGHIWSTATDALSYGTWIQGKKSVLSMYHPWSIHGGGMFAGAHLAWTVVLVCPLRWASRWASWPFFGYFKKSQLSSLHYLVLSVIWENSDMGSLDSSIHVQMPFIDMTHDKSRSKVACTFEFWTSPSQDHVEMMNSSNGVM
jgi:hypothetical protein